MERAGGKARISRLATAACRGQSGNMRFYLRQAVLSLTGCIVLAAGAVWTALLSIAAVLGLSAVPDDAATTQTMLERLFSWLLQQDPSLASFVAAPVLFCLGLLILGYVWSRSAIARAIQGNAGEVFTDGTRFVDRPPPGPLTKEQEEIERFVRRYIDPLDSYMQTFILLNAHHYSKGFTFIHEIFQANPANRLMQEAFFNKRNDIQFWHESFSRMLVKYNLEVKVADELARHVPAEILRAAKHLDWERDHNQALDVLKDLAANPSFGGIHWTAGNIEVYRTENL